MAKMVERKVKDIGNMDGASSSMLYSSSASYFKQALS